MTQPKPYEVVRNRRRLIFINYTTYIIMYKGITKVSEVRDRELAELLCRLANTTHRVGYYDGYYNALSKLKEDMI